MLIAHLTDLHLGFRAYHRLSPGGINARERDVALAFRAALDRVVELRPELVLVAGDVFHSVRPSNSAVTDAFRQFARLSAALPGVPVVVIAGNHDSPRAVETGSILRLFAEIPNVVVVDDEARAVYLEPLDASVLCMPHNALVSQERIAMEPDPEAAVNILMLHGTVSGGGAEQKLRYVTEYGGVLVETSEIRPEAWDYVALGHYHIATELAPNMWYAGGIERTSTNIWEEAEGEKGFVTFDTGTRRATFHPVPTRPVVDLPRLSARRVNSADGGVPVPEDVSGTGTDTGHGNEGSTGSVPEPGNVSGDGSDEGESGTLTGTRTRTAAGAGAAPQPGRYLAPAELDDLIRRRVESVPGGIEGKIVRLVIEDVPRDLFRELDHRRIREYKAEALHFHLDARKPEVRRVSASGAPVRRRTLEEEVELFLQRHWEPSGPGIRREHLVELARRYLEEAGRGEAPDALVEAKAEEAEG